MKNELVSTFIKALEKTGYRTSFPVKNSESGFIELKIEKDIHIKLNMVIKNITYSGWSDKPLIRRVQLGKIDHDNLCVSTMKETALIVGVINVIDKNMFVIWSIYKNVFHNTNKSCYVHLKNIFKGYLEGYYIIEDSKQRIWISDEDYLDKMLYEYMKYNETPVKK